MIKVTQTTRLVDKTMFYINMRMAFPQLREGEMTFQKFFFLFHLMLDFLLYLIYVRAAKCSAFCCHTVATTRSVQRGGVLSRPSVSIVTALKEDWLVRSVFGSLFVTLLFMFAICLCEKNIVNIIQNVQLCGNRYSLYYMPWIYEKTMRYSFRYLLILYGKVNYCHI